MLFHLLYGGFADRIGVLRVFRYTSTRILAAAITALVLSFIIGPWFIERLKARQIGETIRTDGPETHKKKAGTPTMGGSLILFCLAISTLLWCDLRNQFVWLALTVTIAFGTIGFADDYVKVAKKDKRGISGKVRLAFEFAIAGSVMAYVFYSSMMPSDVRLHVQLPFTNYYESNIELPAWLYVIFGSFVVVGAANAVNITDGLDGLAIGPSIMNAGTFLILAYIAGVETQIITQAGTPGVGTHVITSDGTSLTKQSIAEYLHVAHINNVEELAVFAAALLGAGVGFLWYNAYPAQVFMGDVGALGIGGAIGMLAVLTKNELVLVIVGGLFVVELLSSAIQTSVFKATKGRPEGGKRVFAMAPIHHHYEKKGWDEPKIIVRFWLVSLLFALLALGTLKLR